MARRRKFEEKEKPPSEEHRVSLPCDAGNEAALVAAAYKDPASRTHLLTRLVADHFQQREHRDLWQVFQEAERRKLVLDASLVEQLGTSDLRAYVEELIELRPEVPANLSYHVATLLWDHARVSAARGPIPAFIEALRDPKAEPDRVRGLARSIGQAFDGYEDRKFLHDPEQVVADHMKEVEARAAGRAAFAYGIPGLDFFDRDGPREDWRRRMIPGAAPGQITTVTGLSGAGKTTFTAHLVLGIAFPEWRAENFAAPGRTILYGAWEMRGGTTLELLSIISLGWSRSETMQGRGPVASAEGRSILRARMAAIASRVRFMGNPFRRRQGEKGSNDKNLDIVQGYIADSGCEVFVADLWKRCLRDTEPSEEEDALIRQQAMVEDMGVHAILLQQQRLHDIEKRDDKRPTREGIKGSGAWVEVSDTIIGVHRPALFKSIPDDVLEVGVLKQRYGLWPAGVEFTWNPDAGMIGGGRTVDYDRPGEGNEVDRKAGRGLRDAMRSR